MTPEVLKLKLSRITTSSWTLASDNNPCMYQIDARSPRDALALAKNWLTSFTYLSTSTEIEVEDGFSNQP